jgi:hypothetical protein
MSEVLLAQYQENRRRAFAMDKRELEARMCQLMQGPDAPVILALAMDMHTIAGVRVTDPAPEVSRDYLAGQLAGMKILLTHLRTCAIRSQADHQPRYNPETEPVERPE